MEPRHNLRRPFKIHVRDEFGDLKIHDFKDLDTDATAAVEDSDLVFRNTRGEVFARFNVEDNWFKFDRGPFPEPPA